MDTRPAPPRIGCIPVTLLLVGLGGLTFWLGGLMTWLGFVTPAAFVPDQPWFQFAVSAINLVFGLWLLSCGLFFHARFAKAIGTGPHSPLVPGLGPKGTRRFFLLVGLSMLILGGINSLLEWFVR